MDIARILLLLVLVNGAPILARNLLGERLSRPIDGGHLYRDGRPWLGPAKTWRGLAAALILGALASPLLGLPLLLGLAATVASMTGDLVSSFFKRRLGLASSSMALGLDQVPEALFPALVLAPFLSLGPGEILLIVALFFVVELLLSRLLFRLGIRREPY